MKSKSSSQFGRKTWDEMHGGGTSRYPHCRPFGLYNPDLKQYKVKFSACPSGKDMWLVEDFVIASPGDGVEPSKETVYAEIRKKLEDMLWYVVTALLKVEPGY